jgi:radical S-adenosyl methionine domain-containing protein 2
MSTIPISISRSIPAPTPAAALPRSVNYHLWQPCNMRCRYCFATFHDVVAEVLPKGHLPREEALRVVDELAGRFAKVTFAGGEPMLCPWLADLIRAAKRRGATTMLVTNGSKLTEAWIAALKGDLDWITLSIDSASDETHRRLGRAVNGKAITLADYALMATWTQLAGMRLKVNTVVTSVNMGEDLSNLIAAIRPERWKILQVLPIEGQNDGKVEPLLCTPGDFEAFVERHRGVEAAGIILVPEDNYAVRGTYAMVDPAGRFFDDAAGRHRYSDPILHVGVDQAFGQVSFSMDGFLRRGGSYDF